MDRGNALLEGQGSVSHKALVTWEKVVLPHCSWDSPFSSRGSDALQTLWSWPQAPPLPLSHDLHSWERS